ncbi:MAG: dipeptide epimerase, partial [Gemmatimonadota bacterium]|nr:dipeptide epimerase [Gemmatimonadota bacterium]
MMRLAYERMVVHTANPFVIARGGGSEYARVRVTLTDGDGVQGIGEAAPSAFYGETADTVVAALETLRPVIENGDAWALELLEAALARALRG